MDKELRLTGTYYLVSYEIRRSDGTVSRPFGRAPVGQLVYDDFGRMSGHVMRAQAHPFRGTSRRADPDDVKSAFRGYLGYFGTYTLDEASSSVIHNVEGSWNPNWVGTKQIRRFRLEGDTLTIWTDPETRGGRDLQAVLVWKRHVRVRRGER